MKTGTSYGTPGPDTFYMGCPFCKWVVIHDKQRMIAPYEAAQMHEKMTVHIRGDHVRSRSEGKKQRNPSGRRVK